MKGQAEIAHDAALRRRQSRRRRRASAATRRSTWPPGPAARRSSTRSSTAGADVKATTSTRHHGADAGRRVGHAARPCSGSSRAGADVNAVESAKGQSALMFAAAYDRADVVTFLLAQGRRPHAWPPRSCDLATLTDPARTAAPRAAAAAPAASRADSRAVPPVPLQRAHRHAGRSHGAALRHARGLHRHRAWRCWPAAPTSTR